MKWYSVGAGGLAGRGFRFGFHALAAVALIALLGLVSAGTASAQSYRFSSIAVEGNQRIETSSIQTFAGIEPGQSVSAGAVNDAYQNLVATGLFEKVEVVPQGGRLLIRVQEYPTINVISFEGNKRFKDADLQGFIESRPRRVYNPAQAEQDANIIADAYSQTGRQAARVRPVIIRRSDNRVDLVFEVREGRVIEIERLSFVGNRNFSDRRLRRVLETKQAGIFRRIIGTDTFLADRIEFDKQVLSDFYASRGYVDFRILSVASEFSRERNGFFLTFRIQEGQSFDFGRITTVSDLPEIDPDEFQSVLKIKPGVTYSPTLVDRAIARMERLAIKKGLDFIRVEPRITRNDAALTLDVEFNVVRGERVFVERIDIEGNSTTVDRVIRRQFRIVEGDPFNPREVRQAAQRIRALGFFSSAEVNASEGSSPDRRIVDVDVEEQSTGSLSFGVSFSTDDGPGVGVSFEERNFLGRGQFLRFSLSTAESTRSLDIDFREPGFLDREVTLGLKLFLRNRNDDDNAAFDTRAAGFEPSIEFPVSTNGRLQLRYLIADDKISGIDPVNTSPIIQRDVGSRLTSAVGYTYLFDTRRTGLDPNAGVILRFSQDFAGLGGDVESVKTTVLVGAERRLRNEELTLSAELEAGMLHTLNGNSRLTDRFFLNSTQMRGFDFRGIGPRDTTAVNDDGLGGNFFAVARFEARFPLGTPEEYGLRGGVFLDVGSLWGLDDTAGAAGVVDDGFHIRSTVGVSIFWETALGPLRFNFTRPLKKEATDETRLFDMTVSTSF